MRMGTMNRAVVAQASRLRVRAPSRCKTLAARRHQNSQPGRLRYRRFVEGFGNFRHKNPFAYLTTRSSEVHMILSGPAEWISMSVAES
jgi:hypothetical protein